MSATPLKESNRNADNVFLNDKKRAPTTPLTPSLNIQSMNKRQFTDENSPNRPLNKHLQVESEIATPKIRNGIKLAAQENKSSRLQMIKNEHAAECNESDSEYSEMSTINTETPPQYKVDGGLTYYKNGYYLEDEKDELIYKLKRELIVKEEELKRANELVRFMELEREA